MALMVAEQNPGRGMPFLLGSLEVQALNVLPMPVLVVGAGQAVRYANMAAEDFCQTSTAML